MSARCVVQGCPYCREDAEAVDGWKLSDRLRRVGMAGLAEVAEEVSPRATGRRGFPGTRTVAEQRALVSSLLWWIVELADERRGEADE